MTTWFTLDDQEQLVPVDIVNTTAKWDPHGVWKPIQETVDGFMVSTVFLGTDHRFGDGPPLLWETMVFDHRDDPRDMIDIYCERYESAKAAREGHQVAIQWVKDGKAEAAVEDGQE